MHGVKNTASILTSIAQIGSSAVLVIAAKSKKSTNIISTNYTDIIRHFMSSC